MADGQMTAAEAAAAVEVLIQSTPAAVERARRLVHAIADVVRAVPARGPGAAGAASLAAAHARAARQVVVLCDDFFTAITANLDAWSKDALFSMDLRADSLFPRLEALLDRRAAVFARASGLGVKLTVGDVVFPEAQMKCPLGSANMYSPTASLAAWVAALFALAAGAAGLAFSNFASRCTFITVGTATCADPHDMGGCAADELYRVRCLEHAAILQALCAPIASAGVVLVGAAGVLDWLVATGVPVRQSKFPFGGRWSAVDKPHSATVKQYSWGISAQETWPRAETGLGFTHSTIAARSVMAVPQVGKSVEPLLRLSAAVAPMGQDKAREWAAAHAVFTSNVAAFAAAGETCEEMLAEALERVGADAAAVAASGPAAWPALGEACWERVAKEVTGMLSWDYLSLEGQQKAVDHYGAAGLAAAAAPTLAFFSKAKNDVDLRSATLEPHVIARLLSLSIDAAALDRVLSALRDMHLPPSPFFLTSVAAAAATPPAGDAGAALARVRAAARGRRARFEAATAGLTRERLTARAVLAADAFKSASPAVRAAYAALVRDALSMPRLAVVLQRATEGRLENDAVQAVHAAVLSFHPQA